MKIVVLDGFTLNPGDISWSALNDLGECEYHEHTRVEDVPARSAGAQIVLTNKTVLSAKTLSSLPDLRYIGVLATGYNVVDVAAARHKGIMVTNVPAYGTASVAQATFALLLELTNHAGHHSETVRQGRWSASRDFCYWDFPIVELSGLTMGIIGLGTVGNAVASIARGFGMRVIGYSRSASVADGIELASLDEVFANSDIVSLHCPLTEQTARLVSRERLALMKPTAFLINTSRGPLVDQEALANALNQGALAGAGLDVLATEPPSDDNPLLQARNCIVTPHIAWASRAARERLMKQAVANIRAFLDGHPINVIAG